MFFFVVLSKTNILTCTQKGINIIENARLQESDTYSILIVQIKWRCIYPKIQEEMRDHLAQNAYILHKRPILNTSYKK